MAFIFTLGTEKGGVGKTTFCVNLGEGTARVLRHHRAPKRRVLLVDTDSQAHSTLLTTGRSDFGPGESLYAVMMANPREQSYVLQDCVVPSTWDPDLDVLPASQAIEKAQAELVGVPDGAYRLAQVLRHVEAHYAVIIIDTRPSFSLATEMALLASSSVFIPVEPRYLETVGLASMIGKIHEISSGWQHPGLRVSGILVNKMDSRIRGHREVLANLSAHPSLGALHRGTIPVNEAIPYSHHNHQSIFSYNPTCPASRAYAALVRTVLKIGAAEGRLT